MCQITEKKDSAFKESLSEGFKNGWFKLQFPLTFHTCDSTGYSPNSAGIKTVPFWAWQDLWWFF